MTITQMKYIAEVAKQRNVTAAAQVLHVSQPSVSKAIRDLEEEFGVNLFHRVKNRLSITREGEYFYRNAASILAQLDRLSAEMKDIAKKNNKIRIGVPPMIGTSVFLNILDIYREENPSVIFEFIEHGSLRVREMVADETLDIALAIMDGSTDECINGISILKTELRYCVDKNHPLSKIKSLTFADLEKEPVILFQNGSYQNDIILNRFHKEKLHPNIAFYSGQLYLIKQMILRGKTGAFFLRETAELEPDLTGIPLDEPVCLNISLIWKKERHIYNNTMRLIELVKKHFSYGKGTQ